MGAAATDESADNHGTAVAHNAFDPQRRLIDNTVKQWGTRCAPLLLIGALWMARWWIFAALATVVVGLAVCALVSAPARGGHPTPA